MSENLQIVAAAKAPQPEEEEYRYLHDKIGESNQLVTFAREKAELVQWIIDNDCARGKLPKARAELDLMKGKLDELRAMGEELSTGKKDSEGPESSPSLKAMRYNLLSHVKRSVQGLEAGYNELDRCIAANLR